MEICIKNENCNKGTEKRKSMEDCDWKHQSRNSTWCCDKGRMGEKMNPISKRREELYNFSWENEKRKSTNERSIKNFQGRWYCSDKKTWFQRRKEKKSMILKDVFFFIMILI